VIDDADKRRVAAAYAMATRAGDVEALAAISEDDAVVWHNHDDVEVSLERSARTLRWLHRTVTDLAWNDVALTLTADGFVWRTLLTGTAPGGPFRAHSCAVVTLSEAGRVVRTDEYLDAAALAPLAAASTASAPATTQGAGDRAGVGR
jgi:ketosteroid isomerase-like protein